MPSVACNPTSEDNFKSITVYITGKCVCSAMIAIQPERIFLLVQLLIYLGNFPGTILNILRGQRVIIVSKLGIINKTLSWFESYLPDCIFWIVEISFYFTVIS